MKTNFDKDSVGGTSFGYPRTEESVHYESLITRHRLLLGSPRSASLFLIQGSKFDVRCSMFDVRLLITVGSLLVAYVHQPESPPINGHLHPLAVKVFFLSKCVRDNTTRTQI